MFFSVWDPFKLTSFFSSYLLLSQGDLWPHLLLAAGFFVPPAFFLVAAFFFFGDLLDLVGRIPDNTVEHAAPHVFTVGITLVSQRDHFLDQDQGFSKILIAGSQNRGGSTWRWHSMPVEGIEATVSLSGISNCVPSIACPQKSV
ncbi:MAG: hypothetical protein QNJ04_08295 [Desulfobacterales bacterium]|nr:hypothetical protein [Desulfobacterales bacterium]